MPTSGAGPPHMFRDSVTNNAYLARCDTGPRRDTSPLRGLLRRNVKRFREGLVCKAHRLVYHSLGLTVIKKKKKSVA